MLTPHDLFELKARMLLAAEAADRMAKCDGEPLQLDQETYELVTLAMKALKTDVRRVLAEIDILRGMTMGRFDTIFQTGEEHGRSSGAGATGSAADVERVGSPQAQGCGNGERDALADADAPVRPERANRKAGGRSGARRNPRRSSSDKGNVDTTAGEGALDRG